MPPEAVEGIPDVHLTTLTIGERPDLAVSCPSHCIKINDGYLEILESAPYPKLTVATYF
jgi:hypothetical protein